MTCGYGIGKEIDAKVKEMCRQMNRICEAKLYTRRGTAVDELKAMLEEYEALMQESQYSGCGRFHHDLLFNLGCAYEHAGDLEKSVETHKMLLEMNPDNHQALYTTGTNLCKLGMFGEAVGMLERAVELNPENADYHNNLAYARRSGPIIVMERVRGPIC